MSKKTSPVEDIHYMKNYLTEVIARVDFLNPIEDIFEKLPPEISSAIKEHFPILEPQPLKRRQLQVSASTISSRDIEATSWNFYGKDRGKALIIVPDAFLVKYTTYMSYEVLRSDFLDTLTTFLNTYPDIQASRLGLRYINNINLSSGSPLSWSTHLTQKVLAMLKSVPDKNDLSRIFQLREYNFTDFKLRYQFGLHNPDYPAPIKQKVFTLDLDAFFDGLQDSDEITRNLDAFHAKIQELFESSITDELREAMNA